MEAPNSKPHHVLVEEQMERFHWNWDVRAAGIRALARRYIRFGLRGLEAKRRLNGSMLGAMTGYYVKYMMEPKTCSFKLYKRIGKKKEKKNKVLQIAQ